ncbi:MAG: hypothetical protein IKD44_09515 [Lentisphaeria bacterium]|nr:hypothetical protein [Lentisphaeria bacterium]
MFRRRIKILFLVLALLLIPMHQAKAIDPVTIAIMAPVVLQLANAARPYVIRGLVNLGKGVIRVGKDVVELVFLPYGILKMTFGAPFGGFRSGLVYTIRGGIAIGKMVFHILILPLTVFGINFNVGS